MRARSQASPRSTSVIGRASRSRKSAALNSVTVVMRVSTPGLSAPLPSAASSRPSSSRHRRGPSSRYRAPQAPATRRGDRSLRRLASGAGGHPSERRQAPAEHRRPAHSRRPTRGGRRRDLGPAARRRRCHARPRRQGARYAAAPRPRLECAGPARGSRDTTGTGGSSLSSPPCSRRATRPRRERGFVRSRPPTRRFQPPPASRGPMSRAITSSLRGSASRADQAWGPGWAQRGASRLGAAGSASARAHRPGAAASAPRPRPPPASVRASSDRASSARDTSPTTSPASITSRYGGPPGAPRRVP